MSTPPLESLEPASLVAHRPGALTRLLAICITGMLRMLWATLRIRWVGDVHQLNATLDGPCIYALWHGDQLPLLIPFRTTRAVVLVSHSRDGTLLREVLVRLGYQVARGSSSRGGKEGLSALIEALRRGDSAVFAVDGPRGPWLEAKAGAVLAAAATGRPILPLGILGHGVRLRSWDRFFIPYPFSRLYILRGAPLWIETAAGTGQSVEVPTGGERPRLSFVETQRQRLEATLRALADVATPCGPLRRGRLVSGDEASTSSLLWPRLYRGVTWLMTPLALLVWRVGMLWRPDWGELRHERLGRGLEEVARGAVWMHAASVGEVGVARTLIEAMRRRGHMCPVLLTTTTLAGRNVAAQAGADAVMLAPLDLPGPVDRVIRWLQPAALLLIETELWPGLLWASIRHGIPVILVNGRVSRRTFERYHCWRPLFAPLLASMKVLARSAEDASRLRALGVRANACHTAGDLKLASSGSSSLRLPSGLVEWLRAGPLLVAASTHPGEELAVMHGIEPLWARWPDLRVVLAPRHPERISGEAGFWRDLPRRSQIEGSTLLPATARVLWLDTVGELRAFYPFAAAVFVGGTLVPTGGHNLLEAALEGRVCLHGPYVENVQAQVALLERVEAAIRVDTSDELGRQLSRLLEAPHLTRQRGEAGRVAAQQAGRTVDAALRQLEPWLGWPSLRTDEPSAISDERAMPGQERYSGGSKAAGEGA